MEVLNDRTISDGTKLGMIMYHVSDIETNIGILQEELKDGVIELA